MADDKELKVILSTEGNLDEKANAGKEAVDKLNKSTQESAVDAIESRAGETGRNWI